MQPSRVLRALTVTLPLAMLSRESAQATPSSKLTYVRGPGAQGCPDEAALRSAVAERLGYDPFFPWAKREVIVEIDPVAGGTFAGRLQLLGENGARVGERRLGPKTLCSELVRTLALATAIALDDLDPAAPPPAPAPPPPAEPPTPPAPPTSAQPERSTLDAPSPTPPPPERSWTLALGLTGGLGTEPAAAIGARAAVGFRRSWASVALEAQGNLPASTSMSAGRVQGALETGSIVACAHWKLSSGCALASAGALLVQAIDVTWPSHGAPWMAGVGARAGVELPAGARLFVAVDATALVMLTQATVLLNAQPAYTTPRVTGTGALGIGMRF